MDFDLSKENIQPLRGGRNVSQLEVALQAQTDADRQRELILQKEEFERLIRTYTGDDPLSNWYHYISWVEQSYPKHGHEGGLMTLLEHCLRLFENDARYLNDRRLCRLFIKFIDQQENPLELYHMMYDKGLCKGCADMYKAWAYYNEASSNFQAANRVFECGKRELAQPMDELLEAHESLIWAAGQHMIHGGLNEHDLSARRFALTSLHTLQPGRVGSIRTPSVGEPGVYGASTPLDKPNAPLMVYEDGGASSFSGAGAPPSSIVTAGKRQEVHKENILKPGPWTTVPAKKRLTVQKQIPSFTIHEDGSNDMRNFPKETLESYSDWIVSLTIPEPKDDRLRMYPKEHVYHYAGVEFSLEELRANRRLQNVQVVATETDEAVQSILGRVSPMECSTHKMNESHHDQSFLKGGESKRESVFSSVRMKEGISGNNSPDLWDPAVDKTKTRLSETNKSCNTPFDVWHSQSPIASPEVKPIAVPKSIVPRFEIYEQSNLDMETHVGPKGSAMKTPLKDLNAEDLAETGSRGGMDVAAASPVDSAKRLPNYDDDSNFYDKEADQVNFHDLSCNTQLFNFNLNAMKVSTPQNQHVLSVDSDAAKMARKQLFLETNDNTSNKKVLSTILEEKSSSSSLSSGSGTTKSNLFVSQTKPKSMVAIAEEHSSYLAQNLMANAALRSSLGDLMDMDHHPNVSNSVMHSPPPPVVIDDDDDDEDDVDDDEDVEPMEVVPLDYVPINPFDKGLINSLLERTSFPGPHLRGYCRVNNLPKLQCRKEPVVVGGHTYSIEKQLGKGTYGVVYKAYDMKDGQAVALKSQKPPNRWEFYICKELQTRLAGHPLRDRFMDVKVGYFSDASSVFVSEFVPAGSLLDVVNTVKVKLGRPMKECLVMYFCSEMLKVVQAMHEVKIIHADIKPDNFLVRVVNETVALQLIDFGCSIDMSLMPENATFSQKINTENFICCEMYDGRPWSYHTDLFCVAASGHVLLFDKYIQMQKKEGRWSITQRLQRYMKVEVWNTFFIGLLNQQEGPADVAPVQFVLNEALSRSNDYQSEMRSFINILRDR